MSIIAIFIFVFIIVAIVATLIYLRRTGHLLYVVLHEEEVMVIERLGKFNRLIGKGFHLIYPFIEEPRRLDWRYPYHPETGELTPTVISRDRLTLKESMMDIPPQSVITSDNASVTMDCLFFVKIIEPKKVVYEVENFPYAIAKLTETNLRNIVGNMTLDQLNASRDEINDVLRASIKETTDLWGVELRNVQIQSISPPQDLFEAMQAQAIQERKKRVAILEAEASSEAEIKTAQAHKRAMELKADGEATMLQKITGLIGNEEAASQYVATLRYVEAFKELVSKKDGKVVFVPYESSNLMSSLGMVREFFENDTAGLRKKTEPVDLFTPGPAKSGSGSESDNVTKPEDDGKEPDTGIIH